MRKLALALGVALISRSAFAFFDPVTISLAAWLTTSIAMPVSYALGCATTYSPPVRLFGTERTVYGLDWGSLACHAENVYGMQMSFCGGSVEEGVLYQVVKSGTYVTGFGTKEVSDAYEIRSVIESAMLKEAVGKLTKKDLATLQDSCNRMHAAIEAMRKARMDIMTGKPESDFLKADILFHLTLLRASGNSLAEKIIVNAYRRNQFFGTHSHQRTLEHVALAWKFHCEILKACRAKNASLAVKWLQDHIARSKNDALLPVSQVSA